MACSCRIEQPLFWQRKCFSMSMDLRLTEEEPTLTVAGWWLVDCDPTRILRHI
jgi:hypothetical protein